MVRTQNATSHFRVLSKVSLNNAIPDSCAVLANIVVQQNYKNIRKKTKKNTRTTSPYFCQQILLKCVLHAIGWKIYQCIN